MNLVYYFFVFFMVMSYSNNQDNSIKITSVPDTIKTCHSCPGKLIIDRNNKSEIHYCGMWGQPCNYKLINDTLITELKYDYGESVEYNVHIYKIPIYDELKLLTKKRFGRQKYKYIRFSPDSVHSINYNFESELNDGTLTVIIDSTITYEMNDTISSGSSKISYNLNSIK